MSNVETILESIEKLTLLEAAELVKAMEEKFGVSAAAPVAVAAVAAPGAAAEAKALATIPSKEEIYAKMLGCVNSPASGIVGSINAVMASLTRAVAAVRDQKSA